MVQGTEENDLTDAVIKAQVRGLFDEEVRPKICQQAEGQAEIHLLRTNLEGSATLQMTQTGRME